MNKEKHEIVAEKKHNCRVQKQTEEFCSLRKKTQCLAKEFMKRGKNKVTLDEMTIKIISLIKEARAYPADTYEAWKIGVTLTLKADANVENSYTVLTQEFWGVVLSAISIQATLISMDIFEQSLARINYINIFWMFVVCFGSLLVVLPVAKKHMSGYPKEKAFYETLLYYINEAEADSKEDN